MEEKKRTAPELSVVSEVRHCEQQSRSSNPPLERKKEKRPATALPMNCSRRHTVSRSGYHGLASRATQHVEKAFHATSCPPQHSHSFHRSFAAQSSGHWITQPAHVLPNARVSVHHHLDQSIRVSEVIQSLGRDAPLGPVRPGIWVAVKEAETALKRGFMSRW